MMTVEDFVREYGDDDSLELIDGEVCERELNGVAHFCIKNRISQTFNAAGIGKLSFASFVGASFGLTSRMGVTPDVSIIGNLQPICRTAPRSLPGIPEIPISPRLYRARMAPPHRNRHPRIPHPSPRSRHPRSRHFHRPRPATAPQRIVVISVPPHYPVYLVLYFCRERR